MEFPPTYDLIEDATFGEGVVFTDIHMDPNSIPAPAPAPFRAFNDNISDEEEEEEEEEEMEEDPEEDPEEDEPAGIPDDHMSEEEPVEAVPSFYTGGGSGSRVRRTARRSVRFPSTNYASTSHTHLTHISSPTPSVTPSPTRFEFTPSPSPPAVEPQPLSPTPGRVAPPTPSSPIGYTPSSEPSSPEQSRSITPRLDYSPTTLYSIPPSPAAEPQPTSLPISGSLPEAARLPAHFNPTWTPYSRWDECWESFRPTPGASTSAAPLPQPLTDPRVAQLMGRASDFETRISQIEDTVEILPGPAQLTDLDHRVQDIDERLTTAELRAFEVRDRVMFRGGVEDRLQRLEARFHAMEIERDFFRARAHDFERRTYGRGR